MTEATFPRRADRGRGHAAGELLEAYRWTVLEEREGYLCVEAHLPRQVLNPAGQLFGGLTGTYIDYVALWTCHAGRPRHDGGWLSTVNMEIHYVEPVYPPTVILRSTVINRRKRNFLVDTRIEGPDGKLLVYATTSLLERTRPSDG